MTDFRGIENCIQCKSCSKVCPSARNGGIVPHEVIFNLNEKKEVSGIWKCLQCHRCTDSCPKQIDVCEVILKLRNESSEIPMRFSKSKETVAKFGRTVPPSKIVKSQREELGLANDDVEPETAEFVSNVMGGKQ